MATNNILLFKFKILSEFSIEEVVKSLENNPLEETRIIVNDINNEDVLGTYIYSEVYKSKEYDFTTDTFETVTRKRYIVTEFHINLDGCFMDVWGSEKATQRLISSISLAFDNRCIIEPCELSFKKMISYFERQDSISIGKISAKQVPLGDELLGDCSFDLSKHDNPFKVISEYIDYIQKIGLKWKCVKTQISMTIYKSGAISIYRNRHLISEEELKNIYEMLLYSRR